MRERIQKFLDRVESRLALILQVGGVVSVASISAWIAAATDWLDSWGYIAWWYAALIGSALAIFIAIGGSLLRYMWIRGSVIRRRGEQVKAVNPLADQFHKERLKILDLAHPVTRRISNKKFVDCELMGPANIVLTGNGTAVNVNFLQCDTIMLRPSRNGYRFNNAIVFDNTDIIGGSVWNCTVLVPPEQLEHFKKMNAQFLSLTGDPEIDDRS